MRKRILLFAFIYLFVSEGSAQDPVADFKLKIRQSKNDTNKVYAISSFLNFLISNQMLDMANNWADSCEKLSREIHFQRGIAMSTYHKGNILLHGNDFLKADSVLVLALNEYNKVKGYEKKKLFGMIAINNSRAIIKKNMGMIDEAEKLDQENLELALKLKDTNAIVTVYCNLLNLNLEQGKKKEAQDYAIKAEKLAIAQNDKMLLFKLYTNIGLMEAKNGNKEEAIKKYSQAIELGDKYNFESSLVLNNLALQYEGQKRTKLLHLALYKAEKGHNDYAAALALGNLGDLYAAQGLLDSALIIFKQALIYFERTHNSDGVSTSLRNIGEVYYKRKDYNQAVHYLLRAEEVAIRYRIVTEDLEAKESLAKIYEAKGDYKNGILYLRKYNKLNDSINSKEVAKQISTLKMRSALENQKIELNTIAKAKQEKIKIKTDEDKKRQNLIIICVIGGLLLMTVFSIFIYKSLRENRKANQTITKQKEQVEYQKTMVEEKQKEILDSINYAKRIQYTILAHDNFLRANLPDHFIYFNPKDIVSGDFYWATKKGNRFYLAVCDSTGHGVPGAFMSLLNIGFLNEAINEKGIEKPNEILNYTRQRLIDNISKEGQKDGFDGILICMEQNNTAITYAAANNGPILIRNNTIIELPDDRMPVGMGERKEDFNLYTIDIIKNDALYLYTDGYADQFGGPKGKKFKYKSLNELLLANSQTNPSEQKKSLQDTFENWRGDLEQIDDVCIIGIQL